MPKAREYSLWIETPPGDINLIHELLVGVWENSPEVPLEERFRFETALIELASNVIRHATSSNGVSCVLRVLSTKGQLVAELRIPEHHLLPGAAGGVDPIEKAELAGQQATREVV